MSRRCSIISNGVKVIAGVKKNEIAGVRGDFFVVKVTAQREKGKANEALIKLLSKTFECGRQTICIQRGETSSKKEIFIPIDLKEFMACIKKKFHLSRGHFVKG